MRGRDEDETMALTSRRRKHAFGASITTLAGTPGRVALLLAVATLTGCGDADLTGVVDVETRWHEVDVSGAERRYRLYVPPSVEAVGGTTSVPLLLVFHGATQSASGIELMSWLYPAADAAGMLVAYPEASGDYWNTPNSPPSYWTVPDVPFVDAVVEDVAGRHAVDRTRIYATGFSNGAIFAQVLTCLRGESIAALSVVGAGMSASVTGACPWRRPVPTVVFFGDADPQFFWDDGLAAGVGMLGGAGSRAWLAASNGCDPEPEVTTLAEDPDGDTTTELSRYLDCAGAADVDFYRIRGGGHTWPGSPINLDASFGRKSRGLDASATMVDFFLGHRVPEGS